MEAAVIGFLVSTCCIFAGLLIEQYGRSNFEIASELTFNIKYSFFSSFIQAGLSPALLTITTLAVNAVGGGIIALPSTGWRLLPGILVYVVTLDFGEYLFHRAQHRFKSLWLMHSFHHSDPALNASTTIRHYWAELPLKSLVIYLPVSLVFKVSPAISAAYVLVSFYNYFVHMDVKIGFGRWAVFLNAPQYHRIHHSALAEHHNCNFAALFPVFDRIFGSYRHPRLDEFPPTGLDSGEMPRGLVEGIFWPFRRSMLVGSKPAETSL